MATFGPYFLARPSAFKPWMAALAGNYIRLSQELSREPDAELLGPIAKALQGLEEETGPSDQGQA